MQEQLADMCVIFVLFITAVLFLNIFVSFFSFVNSQTTHNTNDLKLNAIGAFETDVNGVNLCIIDKAC